MCVCVCVCVFVCMCACVSPFFLLLVLLLLGVSFSVSVSKNTFYFVCTKTVNNKNIFDLISRLQFLLVVTLQYLSEKGYRNVVTEVQSSGDDCQCRTKTETHTDLGMGNDSSC